MKLIYLFLDICLLPLTLVMAFYFFIVRSLGNGKLVICNKVLLAKGILPTRTYFEESV